MTGPQLGEPVVVAAGGARQRCTMVMEPVVMGPAVVAGRGARRLKPRLGAFGHEARLCGQLSWEPNEEHVIH
jgi:hypothetical protein